MPNGYEFSREEWEKVEAPLLAIDGLLAEFAAQRNVQIVKNYHNWPQRQLDWTSNGIHRSLWILLADAGEMTFHVAGVASKDQNGDRYLKDCWLKKGAPWSDVKDNLTQLLQDGVTLLESWSEKDLMPSEQFRAQQRSRKR